MLKSATMKRIVIPIFLFIFVNNAAVAATAEESYKKAQACYQDIQSKKQKAADTKTWQRCISAFRDVARQFPEDPKAAEALYSAARLNRELYWQTKNIAFAEEAVHLYNTVVRGYSNSALADDSLYQIGLLRHDPLRDDDRARKAFEAILSRYPNGDMVTKAEASLEMLGKRTGVEIKDLSEGAKKDVKQSITDEKKPKPAQNDDDKFRLTRLLRIDVNVEPDATVATIELDRQIPFTRKFVEFGKRTKTQARLTLEFPRTKKSEEFSDIDEISSPYLSSIRVKQGVFSGELIVHFELNDGVAYDIVQKKEKMIIRFFPKGNKPPARPDVDIKKEEAKEVSAHGNAKKPLRIVIDPGHGGKDTGAIGPHGIEEKTVTLRVAKKLVKVLEQKLSANVYLTRTDDRDLPLEKRNAYANSKKADLFVSIHANANKNRKISGIETYYLNNASDEAAKRLALRENKAASKPQNEVDQILLTLFQNYNTEESRLFAQDVHKTMILTLSRDYKDLKDHKVRSALFYVLVGAKCPGILIEMSFISNPIEEKRLNNPAYQEHLADAIGDGVGQYVKTGKSHPAML